MDAGIPGTLNVDFSLIDGFLIFFMQAGFVSLESGHGRAKNVRNIILKNLVSILLCALCWWAVGFAFAYGTDAGGFLGASLFFVNGDGMDPRPWFFTWTFVLSTVTITSGCLAERTHLWAYPIYTVVLSMLVHPIAVHWVWGDHSWFDNVSTTCTFLDFAGGSVVHVIGGLTGFCGAIMCGPRLGRFEEGIDKEIPGHSMSAVSSGTLMLWFGWFGFNCGSTYLYSNPDAQTVNRVALNMTLAAACAGLTALLLVASLKSGTLDVRVCCNGLLSGLVGATGNAGFITPWAACVTGTICGALYILSSRALLWMRVDDPLDSSAVHMGSGIMGVLLTGILARPAYVDKLTEYNCGGLVYNTHGWLQLGLQVLGLVVIILWTAAFVVPLFYALQYFGLLRVDQATELAGIDNIEHGGPAYPEFVSAGHASYMA